jgi:hypothetical protein
MHPAKQLRHFPNKEHLKVSMNMQLKKGQKLCLIALLKTARQILLRW